MNYEFANMLRIVSEGSLYMVSACAAFFAIILTVQFRRIKRLRTENESLLRNYTACEKLGARAICSYRDQKNEVERLVRTLNEIREAEMVAHADHERVRSDHETLLGQMLVATERLCELESDRQNVEQLKFRYGEISELEDVVAAIRIQIGLVETDKQSLESEYRAGKQTYDQLLKEKSAVEETLEIYSYGLYRPYFSFDTPESFIREIEAVRVLGKEMIQSDLAAICSTTWTVNNSLVEGRRKTKHYQKMMIRAFNSECDAATLKVRWNNVLSMEERINNAFDAINKLGVTHDISLSGDYLDLRISELRLTHEHLEKVRQLKEDIRREREQSREEMKAQKEIELARASAEKEEARYRRAIELAREELRAAGDYERADLQSKITALEIQLQRNIALKERAISMAQITKAGHVYIISNIGSFGEDVFKIGMTRRMDPSDRVRELGGASVPFTFDLHAMIYSENAPELENQFHKRFKLQRLNLVNGRKEFFKVSLVQIESFARENGATLEFISTIEAREFRETQALLAGVDSFESQQKLLNILPDNLFESDEDNSEEEDSVVSNS